MTQIFNFVESALQPYTFNPTVDQRTVAAKVTWSLFGRRYYLTINELAGDRIFQLPLIGSTTGFSLLSLRWDRGKVYVTTTFPHSFTLGSTVALTVRGCDPIGYNGKHLVYVPDPLHFVYDAPEFPGIPLKLGFIAFDIDIGAGYFEESTIVYRAANRQFEVTP